MAEAVRDIADVRRIHPNFASNIRASLLTQLKTLVAPPNSHGINAMIGTTIKAFVAPRRGR